MSYLKVFKKNLILALGFLLVFPQLGLAFEGVKEVKEFEEFEELEEVVEVIGLKVKTCN